MNVDELLDYKPSASIDDDAQEGSSRGGKRRRKDPNDLASIDLDALESGPEPLDEAGLKRLILQFERKVLKNQELRVKFADNPTKFMDSELELFEVLQEMHVISTQPELYHVLVEQNIVQTILGLLSHENTDVACAAVGLLQELTDMDNIDEAEEVAVLMDALIDGQIVAQLVSNIERLDELVKEESEGVYNSLAIIENLTDYKPDLSRDAKLLMAWLLKRLRAKLPFDGNKLYTSEILSILIQNNQDNRLLLGELNGIDSILQQLAYYKRHDPNTSDENEYVENLFDCLCAALLSCPSNRELFKDGEGLELMVLILKDKRRPDSMFNVRMGAIKVISHAISGNSTDEKEIKVLEHLANRFVELRGLGILCPILLKPRSIISAKKKREAETSINEVEEHCITIIHIVIKRTNLDSKKRLVNKFIENEYEKAERLIEMHFKYAEKLIKCDNQIKKEKARMQLTDEEVDDEEFFMRRLSEGLFTLQLIDLVIIHLSSIHEQILVANGDSSQTNQESIKSRIIKLITMRANTNKQADHYKMIKSIAREYAEELKDETEKNAIFELVDQF